MLPRHRIISSPIDLVKAANTAILGGKLNEKLLESISTTITNKNNKGRYQHACLLLDVAESMLSLQKFQGEPINSKNVSSAVSSFGDRYHELTPLLNILQMRCQILGRK